MTFAASFLAAFPFTSADCSSRSPSSQIWKLERGTVARSRGQLLHSCYVVAFGRTTRQVAVECISNCAEEVEQAVSKREGSEGGGVTRQEKAAENDKVTGISRLRVEDLKIGGIYKGKVSVVESYGAFVDIGATVDGFIHISRLNTSSSSSVKKVEDVVQVGQNVTVQIMNLNPHAEYISLLLTAENEFAHILSLQPLSLSEQEILDRVVPRRASKIARCSQAMSIRRGMRLETRQRLKAHTRLLVAERQAFQLHQVRSLSSSMSSRSSTLDAGEGEGVVTAAVVDGC